MGLIFVFLDGVGLGQDSPDNPFWEHPSPHLRNLLGGPLSASNLQERPGLLLRPLDALLGVPGLPQSATGQTTLFTGVNAAALIGGHLSAYPSPRLRELIAEHSLLRQAVQRGHGATLANAYSAGYWRRAEGGRLRHSASTLTNMAAGLPFWDVADVAAGRALFWDITHRVTVQWAPDVPIWSPQRAAAVLLDLGHSHDLVMFESFLTDLVGHRRLPMSDAETVGLLDTFLGALVEGLGPEDTLVVTSDHGNFESTEKKIHTYNPVPLLVVGAAWPPFCEPTSIAGVVSAIMAALEGR